MMTTRSQLGDLLNQVAVALDIPDAMYEEAVQKYQQISEWLEEQDEEYSRREPLIYPQGSFRLGTVVRPLSEEDEYDIDLVYERDLRKSSITQQELKEQAGDHLESYVSHCEEGFRRAPKLEEGCRCWTLLYSDRFHMDVLPAIPDDDDRKNGKGYSDTSISITDRDLYRWQPSNPIGYGEWFKSRMAIQFRRKRAALAEELEKRAAEEVPEYKVKTPLQRAVQILKRHRDFHFKDDPDNRPVSIILTTLAAKAYDNEESLIEALLKLVRDMPKHIEFRVENGNNVSWVPNPVNDEENFADRWQDEQFPDREKKFRAWLTKVNEDLTNALKGGGIHRVIDLLGMSLGSSVVTKAANAIGQETLQKRQSGNLKMSSGTGTLGATGNFPVKEHTFYGVDETEED